MGFSKILNVDFGEWIGLWDFGGFSRITGKIQPWPLSEKKKYKSNS
jgi:hypothetical protein